jgi:acetyltransferase-like isoleucine patch superfamily enzyme
VEVKLEKDLKRTIKNQKRSAARRLMRPFLKYFYETHFIIGSADRLKVGERSALANTLINVVSGNVTIGDRSIFGQGVMVITGRHDFRNGQRISINPNQDDGSWGGNSEVPTEGFDIVIGSGVFVASGSIILGKCTIGNNSIVAAGAVVTKDFPDFSIIAGIPGTRIGDTRTRL